jgi:hypothetical protein
MRYRCTHNFILNDWCCVRIERLSVKDTIARLKSLEDSERVTILAEFVDAYGPVLSRTLRARSPKYEAELMNRLITAAVLVFGDGAKTSQVLRGLRFFSKTSKPRRRYVCSSHACLIVRCTCIAMLMRVLWSFEC